MKISHRIAWRFGFISTYMQPDVAILEMELEQMVAASEVTWMWTMARRTIRKMPTAVCPLSQTTSCRNISCSLVKVKLTLIYALNENFLQFICWIRGKVLLLHPLNKNEKTDVESQCLLLRLLLLLCNELWSGSPSVRTEKMKNW